MTRPGVLLALPVLAAACSTADTLTVEVAVDPAAVVAVQDGDGAWQPVTLDGNRRARIEIESGRYTLAWLCDHDTWQLANVLSSTSDAPVTARCLVFATQFAQLTGTVAPDGRVIVRGEEADVDAGGTYSVSVSPGTHDVVAVSGDRLLVHRDVDVQADQILNLPVVTDGVVMSNVTPVVGGASGDVTVYSELMTAGGTHAVLAEHSTTVPVPASELLASGDQVAIGASSGSCTAQRRWAAEATDVALQIPSALTVTAERAVVRWQADPGVDWERTSAHLFAGDMTLQVHATREYLDAAGLGDQLPIIDPTTLPVWRAGLAAFAPGQVVTYSVETTTGDDIHGDLSACGTYGTLVW